MYAQGWPKNFFTGTEGPKIEAERPKRPTAGVATAPSPSPPAGVLGAP